MGNEGRSGGPQGPKSTRSSEEPGLSTLSWGVSRQRQLSPQTVELILALAGQPTVWRYGYDFGGGGRPEVRVALPDPDAPRRPGLLDAAWEVNPPLGRPARHLYRLARRACPWSPRCERPQPDANRDSTWARRRDRRADRPDPARHNCLGARPGRSNDSGASRHVAASGAWLLGPGFHTQLDQARNRRSRQVRSA